ncbi:UbiA family prenyltransferase [Fibrella arboris]|uniref:UbiA family prenyltransferase n=1 Tax=Fibrella arboris TaxID=3242486 RepID=UPI003521FFAF
MTLRAIWLHLRLPFSVYLLPVCLFAMTLLPGVGDWWRAVWVLLIIHVLVYPAANTFNSYYDKDEGSVNGLEAPPPVDKTLFWVSMGLEALALLAGAFINSQLLVFILVYGAFMKCYSHTAIRIKKRPIASWLLISTFQGGFVFLMTYMIMHDMSFWELFVTSSQIGLGLGTLISTLNILALYPVTQVYQHAEDASRGDLTISRLMGVRGTFINAWICLLASGICFLIFYQGTWPFFLMIALTTPGLVYLAALTYRVWQNPAAADYRAAMWMTRLTGWGMNLFFLILLARKGQP